MSTFEQLEQDRAAEKFWAAFGTLLEHEYPDLYRYFTRSASRKKENEPPTRNSHSFFFSLKLYWKSAAVYIALQSEGGNVALVIEKSVDKIDQIRNELFPLFPAGYKLDTGTSDVLIRISTPHFFVTSEFGAYKKEIRNALEVAQSLLILSKKLPLNGKKY